MFPSIVLKCSGFFLKPNSVRTSDWLMSGNGSVEERGWSQGTGEALAPPAGAHANCSPSCEDTRMGSPLQKAPLPLRAVYILSSMQL